MEEVAFTYSFVGKNKSKPIVKRFPKLSLKIPANLNTCTMLPTVPSKSGTDTETAGCAVTKQSSAENSLQNWPQLQRASLPTSPLPGQHKSRD